MTPEQIIGIGREAIFVAVTISAPVLIVGLVIGLVISIFQAVTQIQEMTLTFVPKIFAIIVIVLFLGKTMLQMMMEYTIRIFQSIPMVMQ